MKLTLLYFWFKDDLGISRREDIVFQSISCDSPYWRGAPFWLCSRRWCNKMVTAACSWSSTSFYPWTRRSPPALWSSSRLNSRDFDSTLENSKDRFANNRGDLEMAKRRIEGRCQGTPFIFEDQTDVRGILQHQKIVDRLDVRVYIAVTAFVYYSVLVGHVANPVPAGPGHVEYDTDSLK